MVSKQAVKPKILPPKKAILLLAGISLIGNIVRAKLDEGSR
jgi:hypothetical protein